MNSTSRTYTTAYTEISQQKFDQRLQALIVDDAANLLLIPGIYELASEYYNNDILEEYEADNSHFQEYEDVYFDFQRNILPQVIKQYGDNDLPAIHAAWNDWTDELCKEGKISVYAYNNWTYEE